MRIFQNSGMYPAYRSRLDRLASQAQTFEQRCRIFLDDRFGACHMLMPVLQHSAEAFFTNGDDQVLQGMWARESGMAENASLETILLAQIEEHRAEVFYNLDPMRYQSDFVRRLPGCVRKAIAWRAAPSPGADFRAYDAVVSNFPAILQKYRDSGCRAAYLSPAHDPEMDAYAAVRDRPVDVLFVGGYSRHHRRRSLILEAVARLRRRYSVSMHLDQSRLTRLSESPLGWVLPLWRHRRPTAIRLASREPVFGRELYVALSRAKIVLNGAVDMAGMERGNMRCFEAMGCRALLVSDTGSYPDLMESDKSMLLYESANDVVRIIERALVDEDRSRAIAAQGNEIIRTRFSKETQWRDFISLVG